MAETNQPGILSRLNTWLGQQHWKSPCTFYSDLTVPDSTFAEAKLVLADNTTGNVSTSRHGFTPKAPNDATKFLDGSPAWDTVKDSDISTSDIATNDVSVSKHGFAPKAPNDATKFLRGDGTWAVPTGGSLTVQSGTSTIASGQASTTATITAVVLAKTYLVFSVHIHYTGAADTAVRGRITSTTQLTFDTGNNTAGDVDIAWFVVESS